MKLTFLIIELSLVCLILNSYKEYNLTSGILTYLGKINKNDIIKLYINIRFGQSLDIILNYDSQDTSNKNLFMNIQEYKDSSKINDNKYFISKKYSDLTLKYTTLKEYDISSEFCNNLSIEIIPDEQMLNADVRVTIKEKSQIINSHNKNNQNFESDNSFEPLSFESEEEDDGLFDDICEEDDDACGIVILIIIVIVLVVGGIIALIKFLHSCCHRRSESVDYSNNSKTHLLYPTEL